MNFDLITNFWDKISEEFYSFFNDDIIFKKHFKKIYIRENDDNQIFFNCPNFFMKEICNSKLKDQINSKFSEKFEKKVNCYFLLESEEIFVNNEREMICDGLNKEQNFENYIIGNYNKEIENIKNKILDGLSDFSPIFIYGKSGIGKTHAINAIGNEIKKEFPFYKILSISTEDFLDEAYESIKNKTVDVFKKKFYDLDLLIVDDVQFFVNKPKLNEIFFTIFNKLSKLSKIIILASDKSIELIKIEERMVSRFRSGLILSLKKPDDFSLKKIINNLEKKYNLIFSDDAVEWIIKNYNGENFNSDIRIMIGFIKKIFLNFNQKKNNKITLEGINNYLNDNINFGLNFKKRKLDYDSIIKNISMYYQLSSEEIKSKSRKKDIKFARDVCIYILRKKLNLTYSEIGVIFSNRSHSTIMESFKLLEKELEKNQELVVFIEKIIDKF